jgi:hypothetical protein
MRNSKLVPAAVGWILAGMLSPSLAQEKSSRAEPPTVKLESETGVLTIRCRAPGVRVEIVHGTPRNEELTFEQGEDVVRIKWGCFRIELSDTRPSPVAPREMPGIGAVRSLELELARLDLARQEAVIERLTEKVTELAESDAEQSRQVRQLLEREIVRRRDPVRRLRDEFGKLTAQLGREAGLTAARGEDGLIRITRQGTVIAEVSLGGAALRD